MTKEKGAARSFLKVAAATKGSLAVATGMVLEWLTLGKIVDT